MTAEEWKAWSFVMRCRLSRAIPMKLEDMIGKSDHGRDHVAAYRRRVAVYVLYRLQLGRDDIADLLELHPITVSHAAREIADRIKDSTAFRTYVDSVVEKMEAGN